MGRNLSPGAQILAAVMLICNLVACAPRKPAQPLVLGWVEWGRLSPIHPALGIPLVNDVQNTSDKPVWLVKAIQFEGDAPPALKQFEPSPPGNTRDNLMARLPERFAAAESNLSDFADRLVEIEMDRFSRGVAAMVAAYRLQLADETGFQLPIAHWDEWEALLRAQMLKIALESQLRVTSDPLYSIVSKRLESTDKLIRELSSRILVQQTPEELNNEPKIDAFRKARLDDARDAAILRAKSVIHQIEMEIRVLRQDAEAAANEADHSALKNVPPISNETTPAWRSRFRNMRQIANSRYNMVVFPERTGKGVRTDSERQNLVTLVENDLRQRVKVIFQRRGWTWCKPGDPKGKDMTQEIREALLAQPGWHPLPSAVSR